MSGFDVMMRSQGMAQENTRFYDAQRYQSNQQMVDGLARTGQQLIQVNQFNQQMQLAERELAMQEADAGMRLAMGQQELAMNQQKLAMMQAIDQTDLSRESVRAAKLQNDMATLQLKQQEEAVKNMGRSTKLEEAKVVMQGMANSPELWSQGRVFDPDSLSIKEDKEGAKEALENYSKSRRSGTSATTEFNADRNYIQQMYKMAADAYDDEGMAYWRKRAEGMDPQGATAPQPPRPKAVEQPAPATPEVQEIAALLSAPASSGDIVGQLSDGGGMGSFYQGLPAQAAGRAAGWLAQNKQRIHDRLVSAKTSGGRQWAGSSPDETVRRIAASLRNPNDPQRMNLLMMLVSAGAITREEAEGMVK
jgi:hypothetical protein